MGEEKENVVQFKLTTPSKESTMLKQISSGRFFISMSTYLSSSGLYLAQLAAKIASAGPELGTAQPQLVIYLCYMPQ